MNGVVRSRIRVSRTIAGPAMNRPHTACSDLLDNRQVLTHHHLMASRDDVVSSPSCARSTVGGLVWLSASRRLVILILALSILAVVGGTSSPADAGWRVLVNAQGFDTCKQLSYADYQALWSGTPLYQTGLYLGGVGGSDVGCVPPTKTTIGQILGLNWSVTLFWFGKQSQCLSSAYIPTNHRFSNNTGTAFNDGMAEADLASAAASAAGISASNAIHLDLESYGSNATCKAAAKAFVDGWVYRMNFKPYFGSLYGSSCGSNLNEIPTIAHVPFNIAAAGQAPTVNPVSVYGLLCLNDGYWVNNQRLRQYSPGTHWVASNGTSILVDQECVDERVVNNLSNVTLSPNNCQMRASL